MTGLLIDEQDRPLIDGRRIWLSGGYPTVYLPGERRAERLHRLIANPPKGFGVDHINRNKLDLRRENLRVATQAQNCLNVSPRSNSKTKVRGVWFDEARGKWTAQISVGKKRQSLGRFETFEEAVAVRRAKELELWGEFAPQ